MNQFELDVIVANQFEVTVEKQFELDETVEKQFELDETVAKQADVTVEKRLPAASVTAAKRQDAASPRFMSEKPIERTRANLPHWNQGETCVFVTFRLTDSIPQDKRTQWEVERDEWREKHPQPWDEKTSIEYYDLFGGKLEQWLDAGFGSCALRNDFCRELVEGALLYFEGQRYVLHSFVVMPNHVHVLFSPLPPYTISTILHSWKSYTATAIRKHINGIGSIWQKESWDRLIRSETHFRHVANYIRNNPGKSNIPVYMSEVCAKMCSWED